MLVNSTGSLVFMTSFQDDQGWPETSKFFLLSLRLTPSCRPSNSRIRELAEENERLRLSLALAQSQPEGSKDGASLGQTLDNELPPNSSSSSITENDRAAQQQPNFGRPVLTTSTTNNNNTSPNVARLDTSSPNFSRIRNVSNSNNRAELGDRVHPIDTEVRYHGPTSTLFDDSASDRRVQQNLPAATKLPSAWVQKGLMAEAACQRTLYFPILSNCVFRGTIDSEKMK